VDADSQRMELVRLPDNADVDRSQLTVTLEPSLAAGMTGGLRYVEHYPYECVEQTMSRFLPNVVTYRALSQLGISRPELETALPQQVSIGLQRIYAFQHVDGGWGWWRTDESSAFITSYVVYGLAKAREAGFSVDDGVMNRAVRVLKRMLKAPKGLSEWEMNQQAFIVYALAVAGSPEPGRAGALYEERERLSIYGRATLALALGLISDDASSSRINTLLADITADAIVSATSAHWEEARRDYWNMNTDTRTTSIVLSALATLAPDHPLAPNTVRWLMSARKADRWETTQENAWAIMSLTDWMVATGELRGEFDWEVILNGQLLQQGAVAPASVGQAIQVVAEGDQLFGDRTNALVIGRSGGAGKSGDGQLYYTAHLTSYLPVEDLPPVNRGVVVSREYRLADCDQPGERSSCPPVDRARVDDVLNVKLTIVVPNSVQYLVVEDPLPAGAEAIDTSLKTTSLTAEGPSVERAGGSERDPWWWAWWWTPTHTDLRDEKVAMFATELAPGTYEYSYQIRASLPGRFLTLPATAYQMYFPEVWGRSAGGVFTITE
jgi:hypothetical protein